MGQFKPSIGINTDFGSITIADPGILDGIAEAARRATGGSGLGTVPEPITGAYFQVIVSNQTMGYFSKASGLTLEYEVYEYQEGGENGFRHRLRGPAKQTDLTLSRGITDQGALLAWFRRCQDNVDRAEGYITLLTPGNRQLRKWRFTDAFPVKWEGPNMSAASGDVATETLVVAHHGLHEEPI